jgi:hypothetical protein
MSKIVIECVKDMEVEAAVLDLIDECWLVGGVTSLDSEAFRTSAAAIGLSVESASELVLQFGTERFLKFTCLAPLPASDDIGLMFDSSSVMGPMTNTCTCSGGGCGTASCGTCHCGTSTCGTCLC